MKKLATSLLVATFFAAQIAMPVKSVHATDLQTVTLNQRTEGNITEDVSKNTYTLVLPQAGKISINLNSNINSLDAYLQNATQDHDIAYPDKSLNSGEAWTNTMYLDAGTYYFNVYDYGDVGTYNFEIDFTPVSFNDVEPNNDIASAQSLDFNTMASGYFSWNDDTDIYKVNMANPGKISINLSSKLSDAYIRLIDSNNETIEYDEVKDGSDTTPSNRTYSFDLNQGYYYIEVSNGDANTGMYTLQTSSAYQTNVDVEPNNDIAHAQALSLNRNATGYFPYNDEKDVYKFALASAGKINIGLSSSLGDLDYDIYDSNNKYVDGGYIKPGSSQLLDSVNINAAGTYYLIIYNYTEKTGLYNVNVSTYSQVVFYMNGGTALPTQSIVYNGKAVKPANPTRTGYTFGGWYKDSTLATPFDFNTSITANTVIYAKWVAVSPAIPVNVKAVTAGYNTVTTSWSAAGLANGYEIYRSTTANGTYTKVGETTATSFADTGLTMGTTYYYKVRAFRTIGTTRLYSSNYSAVVSSQPVLANIAALVVVPASYNSIKVAWSAVAGANGYELYRSTAVNGAYSKIADTTTTTYTNSGVNTGAVYYYKVRAFRLVGKVRVYDNLTGAAATKAMLSAPNAPKCALGSGTSIKVSWNAISGANGYEIYRSNSQYGTYSKIGDVSSTNFTNTGLKMYTNYFYKIRAYRIVGKTKVYSDFSGVYGGYIHY